MRSLEEAVRRRLTTQSDKGLLRSLPKTDGDLIDFWSNDYLGLARLSGLDKRTGPLEGSTGSRLLSGNSAEAEQAEQAIARHHGFEAGLFFASGYDANLGLLSCLAKRTDSLILDDLAHASLIDGAQLSSGRRLQFRHNDTEHLDLVLTQVSKKRPNGSAIVVVEATYSMDGDHTPIESVVEVCGRHRAGLVVDEAHSIGVIGSTGDGLVASLGLQEHVEACVYTFGKALGGHGAVVAGKDWLREYLINFCRPILYSTAPPVSHVNHMVTRHRQMVDASTEREMLRQNIDYFGRRVEAAFPPSPRSDDQYHKSLFKILPSSSPIQSVIVGSNERGKVLESHLQRSGFAVKAIRSPTVALGLERIRICLHAFNTKPELDRLVHTLIAGKAVLDDGAIG